MDFINLVFRLGVVLAIFSFIWGILKFFLTILRGGLPLSYPFSLTLKAVQYFIIANIAVLFCTSDDLYSLRDFILTGLILLMYFIGKVQNMKMRAMMIQIQGRIANPVSAINKTAEFVIIGIALTSFIVMVINHQFAENAISLWFYENIVEIEKTPIFGFIFKIVGFFFTVTILFRMVSSISMVLSGKAFEKNNDQNEPKDPTENPNYFDEYEEVKD